MTTTIGHRQRQACEARDEMLVRAKQATAELEVVATSTALWRNERLACQLAVARANEFVRLLSRQGRRGATP